jgi:lipopolysaccharide/colanic/teichoic acid biosynthesis glycosyltransferase
MSAYEQEVGPVAARDWRCYAAGPVSHPESRSPTFSYAALRGPIEVAVAAVLLVAALPLLCLLAALVRLASKGPAIYRQTRVGLGGREYLIHKIRTMDHDCERWSGPLWSTADDPRVTPLGRLLRRTHLDELPQLWNVIKGDMSLIGPRPERPEFVAQLERAIPGYRGRLAVRPGITGLAQVQLPPDEDLSSVRRKLVCDLYYVQKVTPWLDLLILAGTLMKVVGVPVEKVRRRLHIPGLGAPPGVELSRTAGSNDAETHGQETHPLDGISGVGRACHPSESRLRTAPRPA